MNDKELNENIEKIKQLLILPDYDKIDVGIELAVSLEEPRIFEELIDGCMLGDDRLLDRPILNHWMKETIISNGELRDTPTGYYIFLSLLVNTPIESNVNDTLKSANINSLALKECYLEKIPLNIVNLKNLNYIDLSWNRIKEISVELCDMENLETLNVFQNKIKNIPVEINNLENLKILLVGNNILETIPGEIKLDNLLAFDFASNELVKYPDILNSFKNLKTVNFVNCSEGGDLEEKLNKEFGNIFPELNIIEPEECYACPELFNKYEMVTRLLNGLQYFCRSCDVSEDDYGDFLWNNLQFQCDCCYSWIAPYTDHDGFVSPMHSTSLKKNPNGCDDYYAHLSEDDDCDPRYQYNLIISDSGINTGKVCYYCHENLNQRPNKNQIENIIQNLDEDFSDEILETFDDRFQVVEILEMWIKNMQELTDGDEKLSTIFKKKLEALIFNLE